MVEQSEMRARVAAAEWPTIIDLYSQFHSLDSRYYSNPFDSLLYMLIHVCISIKNLSKLLSIFLRTYDLWLKLEKEWNWEKYES